MSYEDYENLFEHLADTLKIDNLDLKGSTKGGSIKHIDKDVSFNKRSFITLDGIDSAPSKPTEVKDIAYTIVYYKELINIGVI